MKKLRMKNIYYLLAISIFITSCGPTTVVQTTTYAPAPPPPVEEVSYQSFYDELSPYGNWINYPGYGYVWMPNAGPDFQPYATNGNWIYTDAGWTWASNYSWGWAPFHYGRWFYENGYGWMWMPGNEWAPAWVSWRGGGNYYGWAPMGPQISAEIALSSYNPPPNYWNFVPRQYMGNASWHNYYVGGEKNVTIINNTTIINNYSGSDRTRYAFAPGPSPEEVSRYSGTAIRPVPIRQASAPGERVSTNQYTIYQPHVTAAPAARAAAPGRPAAPPPAPARFESFNNVRPSAQYPSYTPQNNHPPEPNNAAANNPRTPPAQNPGYTAPASNPKPAYVSPAADPAASNPPGGPSNHVSGARPPQSQSPANNPPAGNVQPAVNNHATTAAAPAKPQPPAASVHPQNVNPPATNPHNPHPPQKTNKPPKKPQPAEQPKPKDPATGGN
jgi:hypothetical protein